ncbi:MAG: VWA domain-containing protein [Acidimicrobiales bacterium]
MRFTNLALLDTVAPERPRWRRHLPAAALLVALSSLVVAPARPRLHRAGPRERATIVVAIDTSLSMMAEDVALNRLDAAKDAAVSVDLLPDKINVGLVSFNRTATVLVSPTDDHESVK